MNTNFYENRKKFWAFVGRNTGLFLTSTRGKLEVLQKNYQLLSKMSMDSVFDANWKDEVEDSVSGYCSLSEEVEIRSEIKISFAK